MKAFDLEEVRRFTAALDAKMDRCDNGEGMECANLDGTLQTYAIQCWEFVDEVRTWGRAVFYRKVAFDPAVGDFWRQHGLQLHRRAVETWRYGEDMSGDCFVLEGGAVLGAAIWNLERLLFNWVTPKPATAPSARLSAAIPTETAQEIRSRVEALPPLPVDWRPTDPRRQRLFEKLRKKKDSSAS